ncbi:Alpha/Beta hydrolase protein [Dipodascopsis uninucleata]
MGQYVNVSYTTVPVADESSIVLATDIYIYNSPLKSFANSNKTFEPKVGAVFAHPYPPLGGSKADNVIKYLASSFAAECCGVAYTFNFRGVVSRTSWSSKKEQADMITVTQNLLNNYPTVKTVMLGGYSYGALIAAKLDISLLPRSVAVCYFLLSPPLWPISSILTMSLSKKSEPNFTDNFKDKISEKETTSSMNGRVLLVYGTKDIFTRPSRYQSWARQHQNSDCGGKLTVVEIPDGPHFWSRQDIESVWENNEVCSFFNSLVDDNDSDSSLTEGDNMTKKNSI